MFGEHIRLPSALEVEKNPRNLNANVNGNVNVSVEYNVNII